MTNGSERPTDGVALPAEADAATLLKENRTLQRRVERLTKEMKNLVAMHDRALKLRDYSEREKKLQYEYNVLLLENAPDMIFILDPEMRFRLGTKAFVHFLGREQGVLAELPFDNLFRRVMPDAWILETRAIFETVLREREPIQYNNELNLAGVRKIFSISIAPAIDSGGKVMGVICLMHDSTELVLMKDAAEAATQAKSSFLASMSHEIRTPMNAIKGLSELMTRTPLSNRQQIYIDNIVGATSSLLMIINDILDFSKIEANRYEIAAGEYDTAVELAELCALMQPKATEKDIYFAADIAPDLPASLVGDCLRIRQILMNVINNAIKFTNSGGVVFSVRCEPVALGESLVVYSVRDTGQGICQEELPKIFQAFEQANFYKNRHIAGTGLGLAISKNLAELMGGEISVASEYGVGSEFTIRIPQAVADARAIACVSNPGEKRALLVVPCREVAEIAGRALERLGVAYETIPEVDLLRHAASGASPTHIIVDGDFGQAGDVAAIYPDARIGCLRSVSELGSEVPDRVRILFKPLLIVDLAAFLDDRGDACAADLCNDGARTPARYADARALVVDDNEINLIVASEILKTYDIQVDTASSGEEAIARVRRARYDIVFMDHMMPGMDGIEATAIIRAQDIPQPTIVALTANAMLGMEELYRKSGFDAYITKPIDTNDLTRVLAACLGGGGVYRL